MTDGPRDHSLEPTDLLRTITYRLSTDAGHGTGFSLTPRHLVTAYHVVQGSVDILVMSAEPRSPSHRKARCLWRSASGFDDCDVSILELVDGPDLPVAPMIGRPPSIGARLVAFGFPKGPYAAGGDPVPVAVDGPSHVSVGGQALLKLSGSPLIAGSSGSPLLDPTTGAIVGVVVISDQNKIARAFPADDVLGDGTAPELAVVNGYRADESSLDAWVGRLSDDQIRRSGIARPTRELRTYLSLVSAHADTDHQAFQSELAWQPALTDVYEAPTLVRRSPASRQGETTTLLRLLRSDDSFGLLAGPGAGKSAALRNYCARHAPTDGRTVPSRVPVPLLASDVDPQQSIEQSIRRGLGRIPAFTEHTWSAEFFATRPAPGSSWLLLVDGLDEVVDPELRRRILKKLASALDAHDHLRVVVATRPLSSAENEFLSDTLGSTWSIESLDPDQQRTVVERWLAGAPEGTVDADAVLTGSPSDLLGNPLLLSLACVLRQLAPTRSLATSRTGLFTAFYEAVRQIFFTSGTPPIIEQAAATASRYGPRAEAAVLHLTETTFDRLERHALDWVESDEPRPTVSLPHVPVGLPIDEQTWRALCLSIYRRSGLLEHSDERLAFWHQALAEYAAARGLAADSRRSARLLAHYGEPNCPSRPWANQSFMRFACATWMADAEVVARLATLTRAGDSPTFELLAQLVADGTELPPPLRKAAKEIARRGLRTHRDATELHRAIRIQVAFGDTSMPTYLVRLATARKIAPEIRSSALLAAILLEGRGSLPADSEFLTLSIVGSSALSRMLSVADHPVVEAAVTVAAASTAPYFDRSSLVEALSAIGHADAHELRRRLNATAVAPLLDAARASHPEADFSVVERAYATAERAYRERLRENRHVSTNLEYSPTRKMRVIGAISEPPITHAVAVATILADLGFDGPTLAAALLHDTVQNTDYSLDRLREEYGAEIAMLVDGVSRLDKVTFGDATQAENVRKMMVAMARDVRMLVIKLATRLKDSRTRTSAAQAARTARETLEVYAPLAHRLGLSTIKWELEDLSFSALYPRVYDEIVHLVAERQPAREEYLAVVRDQVAADLSIAKIKATITGRVKHYYSIYQKMIVQGHDFAEIYDLVGVRVLVDNVRDCYAALGALHARWNPVPGQFKDYIAMPTFDMYQSLHSTVIGPGGRPVEFQFRTHEMHRRAEYGVATRWKDELVTHSGSRNAKNELGGDEVYVLTPKGDVVALPAGSTPLDFAYSIHTEVGHRTIGARINGRLVPLDSTLETGDIVDIQVSNSETAGPSPDWLVFAKGRRARRYIRRGLARSAPDGGLDVR